MTGTGAFFLINLIKMVYKEELEQFKSFFKECPYLVSELTNPLDFCFKRVAIFQGSIHYKELLDERNSTSAKLMEPGEHKNEISFFSNTNVTYFSIEVFFKLTRQRLLQKIGN
jgi:hypothetical protein